MQGWEEAGAGMCRKGLRLDGQGLWLRDAGKRVGENQTQRREHLSRLRHSPDVPGTPLSRLKLPFAAFINGQKPGAASPQVLS